MAKFFIERPIFAIVIALLIMLAGGLSITGLPLEQYPNIAPPTIQVTTVYAGASAETVENTVVQVIEQQMKGLDHLLYISSSSDDTGNATITLTFAAGTNPDIAQVQVQNKLQLATPLLPAVVQQAGITVSKATSGFLVAFGFVSSDGSMAQGDIADFLVSNVQDPVSRIDGVGNAVVFGTQHAMRIWLQTQRLNSYGLTPVDVADAITAQNVQVAGGRLGGTPAPATQQLTAAISEASLLRTPEQFRNILLRVNADGSQVRLRDVARVELGAESYDMTARYSDARFSHQPAAGLAIQLASGANALATANAVRAKIDEMKPFFPRSVEVVYPYDTTPFVRLSIEEVVKTLVEGVALVFLVMYLFMQNFRATLIPTIAVPVVLLGTFGVMAAAGFSINVLTMFGLVLAIGLLVDDAIVVVENVERIMSEEGLSPREATKKGMAQITGALLGVAVVISAVFVPVAFSGGSAGAIYRQFSLTIVSAMVLSVLVALSLTPALASLILKPGHGPKRGFFGWFNRNFERGRDQYVSGARRVIDRFGRWLAVLGVVTAAVALLFLKIPTSFLPDEDQGVAYVLVQAPSGATQSRTDKALSDVADYLVHEEGADVESVFEVSGYNFAGRGQSQGFIFMRLKDWSVRKRADLKAQAVLRRTAQHFAQYPDALILPFNPPAIPGLGAASGFDFQLVDRGGVGHAKLMEARNQLLDLSRSDTDLTRVRANGMPDNPMYKIEVDREKAAAFGVRLADVDNTFGIAWGSKYINNFRDGDGRIKKVYVQADAPYRMKPEDLGSLFVRSSSSRAGGVAAMVPFTSFATGGWGWGSPKLERYNGVSAVELLGEAGPGKSSGQAMAAMERLAQKLPAGVGYEWTGVSLQEIKAGSEAPVLYALSIIVVFLALAALYESWTIPISVIMVVPLGVFGALAAALLLGLENDAFFHIGLLVTIGLSAKNAILIVEFARELQAHGKSAVEAAAEAAQLRLRPILMTSLAFVLGVLPLALASGAGSASEHAVGRGVIGGMLTATFFAPLLVPMFYVFITENVFKSRRAPAPAEAGAHA
jgi:multidrug efflux pump